MKARSGIFGGSAPTISGGYRIAYIVCFALFMDWGSVISAVNGPAIGLGCDVACLGDIRLRQKAKFELLF